VTEDVAAAVEDPDAFLGRTIDGRFLLERTIGQGADSVVFRARQLNLQRDVAVKILLADPEGVWQLGARLRREAKLVAALRHPGLAEVYDEGVTPDGLPYIVMELLRGSTLEHYLELRGRLDAAEAVRIVTAIASVVSAVHAAGFVHRDLKPSNVFVEPAGPSGPNVKVIDFGAVRRLASVPSESPPSTTLKGLGEAKKPRRRASTLIQTAPGVAIGTPQYMSPEQCRADALDERSDVYSLAVVLYELLAGDLPFGAGDPSSVMAAHLLAPVPPFERKGSIVPRRLAAVVYRALDKEPSRRFASMGAFAEALRAATETARTDAPSTAVSARSRSTEPAPRSATDASRPWGARVSLVLAAVIVGAAILIATFHHPSSGVAQSPTGEDTTRTAAPQHGARLPSAEGVAPGGAVSASSAGAPTGLVAGSSSSGATVPSSAKGVVSVRPPESAVVRYHLEELKTPPVHS
jgi:serine/threonine-protein kinase